MFTNRHEIRRIDLVKRDYTQVVPTQKNAVALDVDVASNRMFWCDRFHRRIYRYGAPSRGNAAVQHRQGNRDKRERQAQALFLICGPCLRLGNHYPVKMIAYKNSQMLVD